MTSSLYEGSHRDLFEIFLTLVDDSAAQSAALLDLVSWEEARSLLSIGGGMGVVEATLLRETPLEMVWYLDPSPEQCEAFRQYWQQENLLEHVQAVHETTFQDFSTPQKFDRILSMFSWFYIGTAKRWLEKLLALLTSSGVACLVLPNIASIEADFNKSLSPDPRTTLVSDDVMRALEPLACHAVKYTFTKWLAVDDLFNGENASEASLAFAAFVALRPIKAFTAAEIQQIIELLKARREAKGVPMRWDVIVIKPISS